MRRLSLLLLALALGAGATGCRGTPKGPDVDDLLARLKSEDAAVSGAANLEVIRLGEPAVPGLVAMLNSGDARLRKVAATTLWGLGAKGRVAVPDLAAMLETPETELRLAAAMALDNMGPAAVDAVPALIKALRDPEGEVRQWSAKALGHIGPGAASAVPALSRAAKSDPVRASMEEAIRQIRGQ
ncbi:MAG: HEAT repeat domain-containing protein [Vicinamibacteria bacterium]